MHQNQKQTQRFLSTLSLRRATTDMRQRLIEFRFLSTLSLRRATNARPETRQLCAISIHALLAESDAGSVRGISSRTGISIHALLAESDNSRANNVKRDKISIHALLAESDRLCRILYSCPGNFYPRSPCGERLFANFEGFFWWVISIHALLAESDPDPSAE